MWAHLAAWLSIYQNRICTRTYVQVEADVDVGSGRCLTGPSGRCLTGPSGRRQPEAETRQFRVVPGSEWI
jgi:hypothetical protein